MESTSAICAIKIKKCALVLIKIFSTSFSTKSHFFNFSPQYIYSNFSTNLKIIAFMSWRMECFKSPAFFIPSLGRSDSYVYYVNSKLVHIYLVLTSWFPRKHPIGFRVCWGPVVSVGVSVALRTKSTLALRAPLKFYVSAPRSTPFWSALQRSGPPTPWTGPIYIYSCSSQLKIHYNKRFLVILSRITNRNRESLSDNSKIYEFNSTCSSRYIWLRQHLHQHAM